MPAHLEVPHLGADHAAVRLRPWRLDDVPLVREASADAHIPLITTVPADYTPEAGAAFVRRQWDRATTGTGYSFVIERVGDGRAVGSIGLWLRELSQGRASTGYWVVNSARGQGTAAHALRLLAGWALAELRIPRLQLYVEPWNVASCRTAERAGFRAEGLLRGWQQVGTERRDMIMYARLGADEG